MSQSLCVCGGGELLQEKRRFKLMLNPFVNITQIFFSHSNLKTTQMSFSSGLRKHWEDTPVTTQ